MKAQFIRDAQAIVCLDAHGISYHWASQRHSHILPTKHWHLKGLKLSSRVPTASRVIKKHAFLKGSPVNSLVDMEFQNGR